MTPGERLKQAREQANLSQTDLGLLCGWSGESARARISNYERGKRAISADVAKIMAKILNINPSWILFGKVNYEIKSEQKRLLVRENIPVVSWTQAGQSCDEEDLRETHHFIDSNQLSDYAFALIIEGDSMSAPLGSKHTFPEGTHLIIDPKKEYKNKDFVLARMKSTHEALFKQYINEAGQAFLKSLNPAYPPILINDDIEICGTLCATIKFY